MGLTSRSVVFSAGLPLMLVFTGSVCTKEEGEEAVAAMTAEGRDFHELLGMPRDASPETIDHVYRQLARAYHPDANPGNPVGEEKLKQITEAWETLSDPEPRSRHDLGLESEHVVATSHPVRERSRG